MTTRGERNNNPGNINKGQGFKGEVPGNDPRFATFTTPVMGIRAIAVVLLAYYNDHEINTIQGAIDRWAPPQENNTAAYIQAMVNSTGYAADYALDFTNPTILEKLVNGLILHENGENIYTAQQVEDAVDAAL